MTAALLEKTWQIVKARRYSSPISREEIRAALAAQGMAIHVRDVQTAIDQLVLHGNNIIGSNRGYFVSVGSPDEAPVLERIAATLYRHADSEREEADRIFSLAMRCKGPRPVYDQRGQGVMFAV